MLRVKDDARTHSRSWWTIGIIGLLSLLTLAFHGRGPDVSAEPPAPAAPVAARPPLDVSQVQWGTIDKDTVAYYALRVDDLFKLPGMQKLLTAELEQAIGFKPPRQFQDIEQIAGRISIKVNVGRPIPNRAVMMTVTMIRFNRDMDWSGGLDKVIGKALPCTYKGETFYQMEPSANVRPLIAGLFADEKTMHFYPCDARTLLFLESEDIVKQAIDSKKMDKPNPSWHDQWRQVEDGMFAVVLPDIRKQLEGKLVVDPANEEISAEDRIARKGMESIISKTDSVVLGMDVRDHFSLKVCLKSRTPADAKTVAEQWESIHEVLKRAVNESAPPKDAPALNLATGQIRSELLTSAAIRSTGGSVVISGESTNGMKALSKALADMAEEK